MKNIFLLIAIVCLATACNFSAGVNKDLATGLSESHNGFTIGEAVLVDDQNKRATNNEVTFNKTIAIVVDEIENYQLKDGRAFPGLDLVVTDDNDIVMLEGRDILADENGYSPEDASVLRGTITVGSPMKVGGTYHARMKVWDKLKPESQVNVEVDIVVKE